ncbi:fimbrial protein [Bacillus luteolus]|uniref:Fimbrial protein n=1 Tax=Litchfieldia luteola TaxID=682179 RepID=A0ABR9QI28_9BACI|nr:PilN domain-containing protein [Cytobacillus luteolus]MBE4908149.1 fimbrial protein [Cytobacillus luteolus]MBP1942934.1 type IV pilus assembly protein PilN [Cytobacillus luteolus]
MLVDINLLPQKETKNTSKYIITGIILFIVLVLSILLIVVMNHHKSQIDQLNNELAMTRELTAIEQQKIVDFESSSSVIELENAVEWVKNYPTETVPILEHLIGLLPERGFLQALSYTGEGAVSISVQFDTNREVAYYLKSLTESDLIEAASLLDIQTQQIGTEEAEGYLPRYIAQFDLTINKQAIDELQKEEE